MHAVHRAGLLGQVVVLGDGAVHGVAQIVHVDDLLHIQPVAAAVAHRTVLVGDAAGKRVDHTGGDACPQDVGQMRHVRGKLAAEQHVHATAVHAPPVVDGTEIGAVRVRDGQIVESFTSFVNPGRILPAHITELTGILQEQVDEAETMESVLPAFLEFAGDLPLVGHRILFDYGFLKRAAVNMRLDFERSGVDTLKLSRQFLSELPSRRLSALCEHFEIPIQAHRALEDARATHILYEKLLELYGTGPDRGKAFEPVPLICKVKRESPATKAQKERLKKLFSMHQLVPEYDVEMLTKNEASRQSDRILAAYGSLQK